MSWLSAALVDGLGETEVENLYAAFAGDEDVVGLQVAMGDVFAVRGGQAVRGLDAVVDGLAMRERAAGEDGAQAFAFEQFADHVGRAVVLAEVVDAENVGMIERGDGAGFLLEAAQAVGIGGEGSGKNLDGDIASETLIAGAIDLAHSASAD